MITILTKIKKSFPFIIFCWTKECDNLVYPYFNPDALILQHHERYLYFLSKFSIKELACFYLKKPNNSTYKMVQLFRSIHVGKVNVKLYLDAKVCDKRLECSFFYQKIDFSDPQGTQNTIGSTLFCFAESKQMICLLEGWIRQKTGSKYKQM